MIGVRAAPATRPADSTLEGVRSLAQLLTWYWADFSIPPSVTGYDVRRAMVHLLRAAADFAAVVTDGDCNWGGLDERGEPVDEELDEDWHPDAMLARLRALHLETVQVEVLS